MIAVAMSLLVIVAVVVVMLESPGDDRHVPIGALPLAPGGKVVASYEGAPVDLATNDTFVRWLIIAGQAKEGEREFFARARYALTRANWRNIHPPRDPAASAALSSDGRYRLALLTTGDVAEARSKRLLIPQAIQGQLRGSRIRSIAARGRPLLVAQIDRYVESDVLTDRPASRT